MAGHGCHQSPAGTELQGPKHVMHKLFHGVSKKLPRSIFPFSLALATALVVATFAGDACAQSYSVIHNFTGGSDGGMPLAGLTIDSVGNLYGTANLGGHTGENCGSGGCGVVYRLTQRNSSWVLAPLYSFSGGNDGMNPRMANVALGTNGSVYSSTYYGGGACTDDPRGCGTVFKLQPPASACHTALCPWRETILHSFNGADGSGPVGALIFDEQGNLDGVTNTGGLRNGGTVFELDAGSDYSEMILFHPYGYPGSALKSHAGNLFGSTFIGMQSPGTIYELTLTGGNWIGTDIYDFTNGADGGYPQAGVIFDQAGNLYGATTTGGSGLGGTVFELTPSNGAWTFNLLFSFAAPPNGHFVNGPVGSLAFDALGNLYGTTVVDGAHGFGAVFKLSPSAGGWSYTSLHDFTGGSDGAYPYSNLVFDASGNIYGTASAGGEHGAGVVFEITP